MPWRNERFVSVTLLSLALLVSVLALPSFGGLADPADHEADSAAPSSDQATDSADGTGDDGDSEETTEQASRRRLLYRAMEQMSENAREIILLKEIQGLKVEEIARMLTLPVGTIKSRASRARLELATRVRALDATYGA